MRLFFFLFRYSIFTVRCIVLLFLFWPRVPFVCCNTYSTSLLNVFICTCFTKYFLREKNLCTDIIFFFHRLKHFLHARIPNIFQGSPSLTPPPPCGPCIDHCIHKAIFLLRGGGGAQMGKKNPINNHIMVQKIGDKMCLLKKSMYYYLIWFWMIYYKC